MPVTKQYLRYVPTTSFNIIASPECNGTWVTLNNQEGRYIATGACENIFIWDINLVEKAMVLPGEKTVVTCLVASPIQKNLAAGFRDGTVKTFDLTSGEVDAIFSGHKSSIISLSFDSAGHRLASGSNDTNIVIWDIVAEAGLSRLSGHTGPVTAVHFMSDHNVLLSCSKDTSIKFWDLDTNYCFKTLLGHRTEVWGIVLMRNEEFLVSGCGDSELRVWNIFYKKLDEKEQIHVRKEESDDVSEEYLDTLSPIQSIKSGSILRSETGKVSRLTCNSNGRILAVHGASGTLEMFIFLSHIETLRRFKKRKNKLKKDTQDENNELKKENLPALQDIVKRLPVIKVKQKIKSSHLVLGKTGELRISLILNNNTVEIYTLDTNNKQAKPTLRRRIFQQGHHSEVRAVTFSSDNLAVATGSADSVKLWNRSSNSCLRTIPTGYVVSLCLVPGDRHILAGLKNGKLLIIDLNSADVLEEIPAHEKEITSLCVIPSGKGCVSVSFDCTVKFWDFDLIEDKESGISAKVLSLLHVRSLKVDDPVQCVRISPNSKLIAVALLDLTVKVFFYDTLKFFLSLYGHKLSINCLDISSDSALIITGSGDRNIKIWGLDFGDCHKSIFAHEDSVTWVQFIPKTHYFFSCGKDGKIKQWDADNFQKIITLSGHFGEAWCLSVSPNGMYVASTGSDRVVRLAERSDEPLILEDEAEEERAKEEEEQLATDAESVVKGLGNLNLPSRKTVGSEKGAEQILEALDVCKNYSVSIKEYEAQLALGKKNAIRPPLPLLLTAYKVSTCEDFLIEVLSKIRSSDLEESLMLLPYPSVCEMLEMFPTLLQKNCSVELVVRILMFLIRIHHGPIISNHNLLHVIQEVTKLAFKQIKSLKYLMNTLKEVLSQCSEGVVHGLSVCVLFLINYINTMQLSQDTVGFNFYGLQYLERNIEKSQGIILFKDATVIRKEKLRKRKRKLEATKRAVLTLA